MDGDWKNKLKGKELPDIKYFHSSLSNTNCSIDDYNYIIIFIVETLKIIMIYMLKLMYYY